MRVAPGDRVRYDDGYDQATGTAVYSVDGPLWYISWDGCNVRMQGDSLYSFRGDPGEAYVYII